MVTKLKQLLGIQGKQILLSLPDIFPTWHSRYGERTGFASKVTAERTPKIHAIKTNIAFWQEAAEKFSTGRYRLTICYMGDDPERKKYLPIMRCCKHLHIQKACFLPDDNNFLLVEGMHIPLQEVATNEGLSINDFLEWRGILGMKEFCIVHFTGFRYPGQVVV